MPSLTEIFHLDFDSSFLQAARGERGVDRDGQESERDLHNLIEFHSAMTEALNEVRRQKQAQLRPTEESEVPNPSDLLTDH